MNKLKKLYFSRGKYFSGSAAMTKALDDLGHDWKEISLTHLV